MFPLVPQIPGIEQSGEKTFVERLEVPARHGFMGIEYQVCDIGKEPAGGVSSFATDFNLTVTRIATGAMAVKENLSLSEDGEVGKETTAYMKDFVDYAAEFNEGLILRFIKGKAGHDRKKASHQFVENISAVIGYVFQKKTPLIIEVTNRYETSIATTLAETADILKVTDNSVSLKESAPLLRILPDTFHMNVEETGIAAELYKYTGFFEAVHFSDNNRYLPGYGVIDFKNIITALVEANFSGYIGLEGDFKDFAQDIVLSCDLLSLIDIDKSITQR